MIRFDTAVAAAASSETADLLTDLRRLVDEQSDKRFPSDPFEQLRASVAAVFDSWFGDRAVEYRRHEGIPDNLGTACTVQAMVFGNLSDDCATGVCFTRDPKDGRPGIFGEYLINAQGEDVVAGIRTPQYLTKAAREAANAADGCRWSAAGRDLFHRTSK